jgi:hypothetical protein
MQPGAGSSRLRAQISVLPQMSLSGNRSRLAAITKELALRWEETKNYWADAKSQEFEAKYMDELLPRVDKTVTVIEKLDELLTKVRSDCE